MSPECRSAQHEGNPVTAAANAAGAGVVAR